jgi:hypothetical protein
MSECVIFQPHKADLVVQQSAEKLFGAGFMLRRHLGNTSVDNSTETDITRILAQILIMGGFLVQLAGSGIRVNCLMNYRK